MKRKALHKKAKKIFRYNLGISGTVATILILLVAFRGTLLPKHFEIVPHLFEWNMHVKYMESEQG
jgi:hypothetical protein